MRYAKIDKSTGDLLSIEDKDNPVLDTTKHFVWVPVSQETKPAFDDKLKKAVPYNRVEPFPFTESSQYIEGWALENLSDSEKDEVIRDKRSWDYSHGVNKLGKTEGDVIKTIGDVLDILIAEVYALSNNTPSTQDMADLLTKIQAIKSANPKP